MVGQRISYTQSRTCNTCGVKVFSSYFYAALCINIRECFLEPLAHLLRGSPLVKGSMIVFLDNLLLIRIEILPALKNLFSQFLKPRFYFLPAFQHLGLLYLNMGQPVRSGFECIGIAGEQVRVGHGFL